MQILDYAYSIDFLHLEAQKMLFFVLQKLLYFRFDHKFFTIFTEFSSLLICNINLKLFRTWSK